MRKLLRQDFEFVPEVDAERGRFAKIGDRLFDQVLRLKNGTKGKLKAINEFNRHNSFVKSFLSAHNSYFVAKRKHLIEQSTLNHGGGGFSSGGDESLNELRRGRGSRARGFTDVVGLLLFIVITLLIGLAFSSCDMAHACEAPTGLSQEMGKAYCEMKTACAERGRTVSVRDFGKGGA